MTILRSREIPPVSPKPQRTPSNIEPPTPSLMQDPPIVNPSPPLEVSSSPVENTSLRRSHRLAVQSKGGESLSEVTIPVCGKRKQNGFVDERVLRSGKKVAINVRSDVLQLESLELNLESNKESSDLSKPQMALVDEIIVNKKSESNVASGELGPIDKGKGILVEASSSEEKECNENQSSFSMYRRRYSREEKGKGIQVVEENVYIPMTRDQIYQAAVEEMLIEDNNDNENPVEEAVLPPPELPPPAAVVNAPEIQNQYVNATGRRFRANATRLASEFAHFDAQFEEEEDLSDKEVEQQQVEDWPGPFSTAMKIIKDREEYAPMDINGATQYFNEETSYPIPWAPKVNVSLSTPRIAPSLIELTLRVLFKNPDAIESLDYVPDTLRVKLCEMLCDSRRMQVHFIDLLVRDSPTEIRVPDCSWLSEEQFTECFNKCDTSNLMVLQLDQGGHCMPDYVLQLTLGKSPNKLPVLSCLSLSGAYRLSDLGLKALVSAAPSITSINLSQCSLLTSSSINVLSDKLCSVLTELYINECHNMDMKHILPALIRFEKLQVLSLADLPSVRGQFLKEFVAVRGQTLKQLILTNSLKLNDSGVKAIAEYCPNLSVLDLANVCKLTDSSLGYLANGCQALEKLIFCRNSFSDEAMAAFVETAGGSLKELSLNNVKKVNKNTALALAKHSRKLEILDVSWCREMSNESLGYIADNCSSLKLLKLFGCTQITDVFVRGHSNLNVKILGLKMDPFLNHLAKSLADS